VSETKEGGVSPSFRGPSFFMKGSSAPIFCLKIKKRVRSRKEEKGCPLKTSWKNPLLFHGESSASRSEGGVKEERGKGRLQEGDLGKNGPSVRQLEKGAGERGRTFKKRGAFI